MSVIALLALCSGDAVAQTKPKLTDVGEPENSDLYRQQLFLLQQQPARSCAFDAPRGRPAEPAAYRNTSVTISGSGFDWHDVDIISARTPSGAIPSMTEQHRLQQIDKLFDVAIMMDCSQCPMHPQLGSVFTEFAKKGSDAARKNGAKPVFFMSWAYADKPEMTAQLAEAYTLAGNENDAFVIPAGSHSRTPSPSGRSLISTQPTSGIRACSAPTSRRQRSMPRFIAKHRSGMPIRQESMPIPRASCKPSHGRRCRTITARPRRSRAKGRRGQAKN